MSNAQYVLTSDYREVPIESLAKKFLYANNDPDADIVAVRVSYARRIYEKKINYDNVGRIDNTFNVENSEFEWNYIGGD